MNYSVYDWVTCGRIKVVHMLLGQLIGYSKFPFFVFEWDSRVRNQHWYKKDWLLRKALVHGEKNTQRRNLVNLKNIVLLPLSIKLRLMKQFVKALPKYGQSFQYLCEKFPHLLKAKQKEVVFVGRDIRKMMFESQMMLNEN